MAANRAMWRLSTTTNQVAPRRQATLCSTPTLRSCSSSSSSSSDKAAKGKWAADDPGRFGRLDFWEHYHHREHRDRDHHEWFVESEAVLDIVTPILEQAENSRIRRGAGPLTILHLGCGTSSLGVDLASSPIGQSTGLSVTNVDFSPVAIEAMRDLHGEGRNRNMWMVGDICNLPHPSGYFDIILDKGTFDALEFAHFGQEKNPEAGGLGSLCLEMQRVLAPHSAACWLQITHTDPELRLELLNKFLPNTPPSYSSSSSSPAASSATTSAASASAASSSSSSSSSGSSAAAASRNRWSIRYRSIVDSDEGGGFEYYMYTVKQRPYYALRDKKTGEDVELFTNELAAKTTMELLRKSDASRELSIVDVDVPV